MIYDEGFYIDLNEKHYTAFFYYFRDDQGEAMSYCGKSIVGWFEDPNSGEKACFRAEKNVTDEESQSLYVTPVEEMFVVSPTGSNLLQTGVKMNSKAKALAKSKAKSHAKKSHDEELDHELIVSQINALQTSWKASVHEKVKGKNLKQMNKMAGHKNGLKFNRRQGLNSASQGSVERDRPDVSDLPDSFDWSNVLPQARDQKDCGSCYVFSTMEMVQTRLNINYNIDVQLSPQHVLDCSFHNQGCDGGYPFLVGKFGNEFELVQESCHPYKGYQDECGACDVTSQAEIYRMSDYGYVGGSYGNCNERAMMLELMQNGPFVVSFNPTTEFMYYSGGVFQSTPQLWEQEGLAKPEWEEVDHAVLLYGWGTAKDGTPYWMVLNSWGTDWGENGTFRILRGQDECAIESIGESAKVSIVQQ